MLEHQGRRVLVVEDEMLIALDIQDMFEEAGAEVARSATLTDGLREAKLGGWDLAILDVSLGKDVTCEPIARELHSQGVPFVLHSGGPHQDAGVALISFGMPIVEKPSATAQIMAAARKALSTVSLDGAPQARLNVEGGDQEHAGSHNGALDEAAISEQANTKFSAR